MQTSIARSISCKGKGLHSGLLTNLELRPAPENTGILFIRTDLPKRVQQIQASYLNVVETTLSTSISNIYNASVSTIEHLMAALWGCDIDNIIILLDGPEVPILDGSSKDFVSMLNQVGQKQQNVSRRYLRILKEVKVEHKDSYLVCQPNASMVINLSIDFPSKVIGKQQITFTQEHSFQDKIAFARTFGFLNELDYLQKKGLAKGASLENVVGIQGDEILNHEGLRCSDEFVRHKLLDLLGDLYTAGGPMIAKIHGEKTGHKLNNNLLRTIFSDPTCYEWSYAQAPEAELTLTRLVNI